MISFARSHLIVSPSLSLSVSMSHRFIYERMLLTPWVITESFVKGYLEKGGEGMLRLFGLGDPSGNGHGFSLLK
jgi:hypothetical protein